MVEQIVFILQGFGLVMAVLALLWLISALLGRVLGNVGAGAAPPAKAPPTPAPAPRSGIPTGHLAAIAAAVAVATSGRGRVVRILAPAHGSAGWIGAGRTGSLLNKRVRWDWQTPELTQPSSPGPAEDSR